MLAEEGDTLTVKGFAKPVRTYSVVGLYDGSTKGANWFQGQKNGDGTVMFGSSGSTQFPYLLGDPRVKYEYKDWNPVMATGTGGVAYLAPDLGAKFDGSANNLKGVNFIYGSQGATRLDLVPLLAWKTRASESRGRALWRR